MEFITRTIRQLGPDSGALDGGRSSSEGSNSRCVQRVLSLPFPFSLFPFSFRSLSAPFPSPFSLLILLLLHSPLLSHISLSDYAALLLTCDTTSSTATYY